MILNHIIALISGFIMDLIIGDPYSIPHPVRWIGSYISIIEKKQRRGEEDDRILRAKGMRLVAYVCLTVICVTAFLYLVAYRIHPVCGIILESIMTWQILAIKSLRVESTKVYDELLAEDLDAAKKAVSMIVGRDTEPLDKAGVIRAAVETVAENTSDGVVAPMFYLALFGPVGGMLYKAINTMDSMVGYKNDRYLDYGRAAAKLDDAANFIPSRISAFLVIIASLFLGGEFDGHSAYKIYKRDRFNHASPNSAQTESACAGALGLRLAGDAYYFGKLVEKPYIGDEKREIESADIIRVNKLMYAVAFLSIGICLIILAVCYLL